jgi:hypothetical protein
VLHAFYSSLNIIRMTKSRRMRWAGNVACMGPKRNVYRFVVGKREEKRPLQGLDGGGRITLKCLREIGWGGMDWINLAQDRDQ